ncbi:class I SAM-dependent methyltransferase [Mesobacterium pallidum]|uniref:class I SAM-dependent methyltransferase n=1 Tax=Mesobacterium pallidum TaxID=2872037 RepID=UPI001EE2C3E9|nr:class I SAM-dependent methyltransferase [Mesobacterium pallidum]
MSDHVDINRDYWDGIAPDWAQGGEHAWAQEEARWGVWNLPEAELALLPADMTGMDAVELGCGTGYVSAWMARRGARVTGLDVSEVQLETARRMNDRTGAGITFLTGDAERTGLPDASFDFAISEYGAAIWCDPEIWLREAWRLLRPGGELVFLGTHPMMILCSPLTGAPAERALHRPLRGLKGADWTNVEIEPAGVEFNLSHSGWHRLFAEIGFGVVRYLELFGPKGGTPFSIDVAPDWGHDYPIEQVWHLRKPA